jgi:L,D-transpeptidase catalytic domain/Putative peptidoglycan binding domain
MAMSKRKRILLTLIAIISIVAIVGVIWTVKYMKNTELKLPFEADKTMSVFSSNIVMNSNVQIIPISPQLKKEQKLINDFATARIQYKFGEQTEIIDKDLITKWITLKGDQVVLDEDKVKNYVEELAKKYDTVGSERTFVDSHGELVRVSGGPYGWEIDQKEETSELIALIEQKGTQKDREPVYKQKALVRGANDIGNTYVEVNMSEQKMWFYKDGELIVSTNIVTGNMAKGHDTPTIVGYIYNKVRNTNLVGDDYVAFVNYWMKVYGSIGIHDASWRSKFGGSIYTTNGSHGCINTPYDNVRTIFDNIEIGTPVILFYEKENEQNER